MRVYLVLVVDEQQDLGVVLVHDGQQDGLEDGLGQGGGRHVALPPEDGVENVEHA